MSDSKKPAYGVNKARPSLANQADKFNTAPPPGYVAGRGRGISGFSQPSADDLRAVGRGKGGGGGGGGASGSGSSAPTVEAKAGENLDGEAGDTRELDLSETERFEQAELSMNIGEAGNAVEAFSMSSERKEGHFDDDFNFVWKRKGEDPDDVHDAWLGEVDTTDESDEKVEKRRKLLQRQIEMQQQPEEPKPDSALLLARIADVLQEGETVAAALRRLSGKAKAGGAAKGAKGGVKRSRAEAEGAAPSSSAKSAEEVELDSVLRKQQFDDLTEAADALLRAGRFDVYSETKEKLRNEAGAAQGGGAEEAAAAALAAGIDEQTHASAVGGGFVFDASHKVYFNESSGLYFDPRSQLYWNPAGGGYFYWDAAAGQFVAAPDDKQSAAAAAEP